MRRVLYISGTRADFGLMRRTLLAIDAHPALELSVAVTGMHLSEQHGATIREIEESGVSIALRVPVPLERDDGAQMARNMAAMLAAFTAHLEQARPDIVLLLGDRGEMLSGAIAALHANLPVVHVHGGERSGTIDEPVRHAISKLAHLHCTATEASKERLVRMGEEPAHIEVTGAPGLDGIVEDVSMDRFAFFAQHNIDAARPVVLLVFHPVHRNAADAGNEMREVLGGLASPERQIIALMPNADAGSGAIRSALEQAAQSGQVRCLTHLSRPNFLAAMAHCDLIAGNSSAGIIEAASFGTPVLDIGERQNLRERGPNVRHVRAERGTIRDAATELLAHGRFERANLYGDGQAGGRIAQLLADYPLGPELLAKSNAY
ncbi:MAG: UDP-N-acetylglucosamine 2-epimerase [Erythrobacter sp.]|jgi:GDP/UDP-N,N'-diacetylbacillosamine 2-epimerase (hydrolysing)|nr:UDP-N-acetylglucosamine 2-epimerase [Erythrobacter sp.]